MRPCRRIPACVLAVLPLLAGAQEPTAPIDTDLTEEVRVRYVIIDALVLDGEDRIVPDLAVDDFELYLDLRPHPIETVDVDCPAGAAADPRPVEFGQRRQVLPAPDVDRRIVLAVDYKNLPQTRRVEVVERLARMVRDAPARNEELMVVAITHRLRVEQPFTTDREKVLQVLDHLKHDASLWQETPRKVPVEGRPRLRAHLHEFDLFDALAALVRALSVYEGSKAIVLFSDLPSKIEDAPFVFSRFLMDTPPAFDYDRQFEAVATAATDARVAIYTTHSRGLSVGRSSDRLARLAVESGGRFTRNTNDLSLAYARAQRDLACRYAIGFYDRKPERDELHRINVKVRRPGLRVIHPALYRFGSTDGAVDSIDAASFSSLAQRRSEAIGGGVFSLRPLDAKRWEAALALRFAVAVPPEGTSVVEFGAKLDDDALRSAYTVSNSLTVQGEAGGGTRPVSTVEPVELGPGVYHLSIVVNDPLVGEPRSAARRIELPALPRRGILLVEPVLVRPAEDGLVVHWSDGFSPLGTPTDADDLELVLAGQRLEPGPLSVVARVCRMAAPESRGAVAVDVERRLVAADGAPVARPPASRLEFLPREDVTCRMIRDELPASLEPGTYRFEVSAHANGMRAPLIRTTTFKIGPAMTAPPP